METPATNQRLRTSFRLNALAASVVAVSVLYLAWEVFVPLALAILLAFLLAPLTLHLRRWHFGRFASVLCVVVLAFSIVAVVGGLVVVQVADLAHKLPQYQQNIHKKLQSINNSDGGLIHRLSSEVQSFTEELNPPSNTPAADKPVPVEIRSKPLSPLDIIQGVLGSLVSVLLMAAIVVVFVIFMLFQREDLRDRLIRLMGASRLNVTTAALDEAAHRMSRYLRCQLLINAAYGVCVGAGLYFMGVPNPLLWAVLAGIFRYVPYLGIWIAALMPVTVAFAVSPGWMEPVGILALYASVDLVFYNLLEPLLYRASTGISPIGILVAAVFWTWLWGPVGLLLSTPLTVCLVVVGRYVPSLEFLGILLSDEPVLSAEKRFYQRLLAMDLDEATEIAAKVFREKSLAGLYDELIVPALTLRQAYRQRDWVDENRDRFMLENTRLLVEHFAELAANGIEDVSSRTIHEPFEKSPAHHLEHPDVAVLCMPARDEADEIAALMLARLLDQRGVAVEAVAAGTLASERLGEAARAEARLACIVAVPPGGNMHVRYLAKRLHAGFPKMQILAALLNPTGAQQANQREAPLSVNGIAVSLSDAVSRILPRVLVGRETTESVALTS